MFWSLETWKNSKMRQERLQRERKRETVKDALTDLLHRDGWRGYGASIGTPTFCLEEKLGDNRSLFVVVTADAMSVSYYEDNECVARKVYFGVHYMQSLEWRYGKLKSKDDALEDALIRLGRVSKQELD